MSTALMLRTGSGTEGEIKQSSQCTKCVGGGGDDAASPLPVQRKLKAFEVA